MSEKNLYELATDLLLIIRGGIASDDDDISIRQISDWIRSAYVQYAQAAITQIPAGKRINETWLQRYNCIPIIYPAEAPCGCEKLGFWVGKVRLPNLLTRQGRPAIEYLAEPGYGKSYIQATVDTVSGIVQGNGLQASLRNKMLFNAYYFINNTAYIISSPKMPKPTCVSMHIAQADPFLRVDQGEYSFSEEYGARPTGYPDQFIRSIRLDLLSKEVAFTANGLQLTDKANDSTSNP